MKLEPYPKMAKRTQKVVKHYFNHREQWWVVDERAFPHWQKDWTTIRAAGAFEHNGGWRRIQPETPASAAIDDGHEHWFSAAQAACAQARERHTVFPSNRKQRISYVGAFGVTVIVQQTGGVNHLVTAWRVAPLGRADARSIASATAAAVAKERRKSGYSDRAAVRRRQLATSYQRGFSPTTVSTARDPEEKQ